MENEQESKQVFLEITLELMSELYRKICNCRKNYKELNQNLELKFHLDDCPYKIALREIGYE